MTVEPAPVYRPGARLRQAREQAGLTLAAVAAELNLSLSLLEALEADDYAHLPEPVFVRGYMRRYADRVGLSPEDIAERFDEFYQADTGISPEHGLRPNPVRVLSDVEVAPPNWKNARPRRRKFLLPGVLAVAAATAAVLLAERWPRSGGAPAAPVQTVIPGGVVTAPAADRLVLNLQQDCRIVIRDADGRELANGTYQAGGVLKLEGVSPFSIELNPAGAVRLQLNEQAIDLGPYTVNDIVNFRLSR